MAFLDSGEECDDGNNDNADACQGNCRLPVCGDGIKDDDEECDDGNNSNADGCQGDCKLPVCGDGIKDDNEECDDGNTVDARRLSGRSATIPTLRRRHRQDARRGVRRRQLDRRRRLRAGGTNRRRVCGDGIAPDSDEECDDGNIVDNADGCQGDCQTARLRRRDHRQTTRSATTARNTCDDNAGDGCPAKTAPPRDLRRRHRQDTVDEECDDGNTRRRFDGCHGEPAPSCPSAATAVSR